MAKLETMLILMIVVQAVMILTVGQEVTTIDPITNETTTSLWQFATNTENWNSYQFITGFLGIASIIGVGVAIGAALGFITDFIIFAVAVAGLISMGGVFFMNLAQVLRDNLTTLFQCVDPGSCEPVSWIIGVVVGPLFVLYVWTVISWWRGRDQ